jgi:hypothetical protein
LVLQNCLQLCWYSLSFRTLAGNCTAISEAKEGEVIGPIQTRLSYHILKIEEWFPTELSESVREEILESLFQAWLRERVNFTPHI